MPSILSLEQRLRRIAKRLEELQLWLPRESLPLTQWTLDGTAIPPGTPWQDTGPTRAFHHPQITVPQHWPLQDTRLHLWLGGAQSGRGKVPHSW